MNAPKVAAGNLLFHFAYDGGFEIDLSKARDLCAAIESPGLSAARPAPPHLKYHPKPLVVPCGEVVVAPEGVHVTLFASAKIFDFGAMSMTLALPVENLPWDAFVSTALRLSTAIDLESAARDAARALFERIRPAVSRADFIDLVEDYAIWHVGAFDPPLSGAEALSALAPDIARLLTLERGTLCDAAVAETVRAPIRYYENDLVLSDWSAAFVLDPKFGDTAEVLEFLNVQMLELRFFDRVLAKAVDEMAVELKRRRSFLSLLYDPYESPLRRLSEIKIDISTLRERMTNTLKLAGDDYLARVHDAARRKSGADQWEATIRDRLATIEDIYDVLNNRAAASRAETLETVIIVLILFEIVWEFVKR